MVEMAAITTIVEMFSENDNSSVQRTELSKWN